MGVVRDSSVSGSTVYRVEGLVFAMGAARECCY